MRLKLRGYYESTKKEGRYLSGRTICSQRVEKSQGRGTKSLLLGALKSSFAVVHSQSTSLWYSRGSNALCFAVIRKEA